MMFTACAENTAPITDEECIEIPDASEAEKLILAQRSIGVGSRGRVKLSVEIGAVGHLLDEEEIGDAAGDRVLFGVFARNNTTNQRTLVQTLAGPLRFRSRQRGELQFARERAALDAIAAASQKVGKAAVRHSGLIVLLPGAKQSEDEIYESAAPGVYLWEAVAGVDYAMSLGRLTPGEGALILKTVHESARAALDAFHELGLVHGHPHRQNIMIDPATCNAVLFDYTFAIPDGAEAASARPDEPSDVPTTLAEDNQLLDEEVEHLSLFTPEDEGPWAETGVQAAMAKLESAITLLALFNVTRARLSDEDIKRFISTQRELILEAPTVVYPTAS